MSADITIYSTSICAICEAEMKWLDKKGVAYNHVVVDESDDAMEQFLVATGGVIQSPPFTVIRKQDGEEVKVAGFDMKKITAAIS